MEFLQLFELTKSNFSKLQLAGKRYNYPISLKKDAVKLLAYYPAQTLCRELGVTAKSLRNWQDEFDSDVETLNQSAFVPVSLSLENTKPDLKPSAPLALKLPHNLQLILPDKPIAETAKLICALVKEFSQCSI